MSAEITIGDGGVYIKLSDNDIEYTTETNGSRYTVLTDYDAEGGIVGFEVIGEYRITYLGEENT